METALAALNHQYDINRKWWWLSAAEATTSQWKYKK